MISHAPIRHSRPVLDAELERVDVNLLLQHALEKSGCNFESSKVNLSLFFDLKAPLILSDERRLQAVFDGMIASLEVAVSLARRNGKLTIMTRGTGAGIRISFATEGFVTPVLSRSRRLNPFRIFDICSAAGVDTAKWKGQIASMGGRTWCQNLVNGAHVCHCEFAAGDASTTPTSPLVPAA